MSLVKELGESEALKRLEISRQTFGRVVGGLPVRRGTSALVSSRLQNPQGPKAA